jgi:hypothetical protein
MKLFIIFGLVTFGLFMYNFTQKPNGVGNLVFEEKDGIVAVEAEHFYTQSLSEIRKWEIIDTAHSESASGNKYVECLPDTRTTHDDKLTAGENFSNKAGQMAVLHYSVHFNDPGKYYVWVRTYSTGTEDNGIHVGVDNEWPESGQRMQWCEGKNKWTWDSKQRTLEVHCGVPELIFLEIKKPGLHDIQFSMREDGFEFDKFIMTKAYDKPQGVGLQEVLKK